MPRKRVPDVVRSRFFDLVCAGSSLAAAAGEVGVAKQSAWEWWGQSAPVTLELTQGRSGGLTLRACVDPGVDPGVAPGVDPGVDLGVDPGVDPGVVGRRQLTSEDRAVIASCLQRRREGQRVTQVEMARLIGRDKSVISREIARNSGPDGTYHGGLADKAARLRRQRPKAFKLKANPGLCALVETGMDDGWSPGLIAAMLREEHPGNDPAARMARVSHETIYRALYVQTRGSLRKDLTARLATKRRARKSHGSADARGKSLYREAFKISDRPAEVADRAVPGHWEGDLILGTANGSAVGTLVERSTRFTMLLHLPGRHDADSVAEAMIREMGNLPIHLRRSLTWDRGSELAGYRDIEVALDMPIYFCDPHSPWQRGTNENTNRLLRFWLEKGTDLSIHTAEDLERIAATLNKRPRPTLG
ncbi:IS30 family transposase, partial [Nocardioides sp.]|uniref:IS30 family transposase n=1 Tax=Nocardioides sp. TaxID=35761 RepID=UPI003BEEF9B6